MESPVRRSDLKLIETMRWDGTGLVRGERHLARLARSAAALGFPCDRTRIEAVLRSVAGAAPLRVRLTLDAAGEAELATAPLAPARRPWRATLSPHRLRSDEFWLRHKTTARQRYEDARRTLPPQLGEVLFANERDEICEGTITSLFFDRGDGLATPPLACGLLPGILREELLETGRCTEAPLPLADLGRARLWVGNSLRGLIPCRFADAI